jgi:hypothetical protein
MKKKENRGKLKKKYKKEEKGMHCELLLLL